MRETVCAALAGILLCTALPTFTALRCRPEQDDAKPVQSTEINIAETQKETTNMQTSTLTTMGFDEAFNLPVQMENGIDSMPLHDYLVGALAGEMPLSFDLEALKAQAIACRTYALRQYATRKHDPAAVCTVSSCCECWKTTDTVSGENRQKAEQAVSETDGIVMTYDGALIEATFFSCSGGQTETAADVWGNDIPYLHSVSSPGEEQAPHYTGKVKVSLSEFTEKLRAEDSTFAMPNHLTADDFVLTHTEGGGVKTVQLGGVIFTGKMFRKLFDLDSTDFKITVEGQSVVFTTSGYGHRVGMSQYGAQAMAASGADCEAILLHYYTNIELTDCRTFYPQLP